jgi:hypothetical protein
MNLVTKWAASPIVLFSFLALLLAACGQVADGQPAENSDSGRLEPGDSNSELSNSNAEKGQYDDLQIVTLLPRDAIPAIDDPQFLTVEEANGSYDEDELVMGVEFNGDARAYSIPLLSSHEIVNDTVGGVKIAVTW